MYGTSTVGRLHINCIPKLQSIYVCSSAKLSQYQVSQVCEENKLHDEWDISLGYPILTNVITSTFQMFDKLWDSCIWFASLRTALLEINATRYCSSPPPPSITWKLQTVYSRKSGVLCKIYFASQVLTGVKGILCITFRACTISRARVVVVQEFPFLLSGLCRVPYS